MSKFYTYRQNNSGGFFRGPTTVIVEADSAAEANDIAENSEHVYFDGCATDDEGNDIGRDCSCCGDRWSRAYEGDGTDTPQIYGEPAVEGEDCVIIRKTS
jgi:hypothetical protein